jgi:hypothetical protein
MALGSVAWLFIASYLPVVVYSVWSTANPPPPQTLHMILNCAMGLSVSCNPIIYGISNKTFRGMVTRRLSVAVGTNYRMKEVGLLNSAMRTNPVAAQAVETNS